MPRIFEPKRISLGWYLDEEIRQLSSCEVAVPASFDAFCHPVPDGLYDQRMGPNDSKQECHTCHLSYIHCPGHFGHIVLSRPVLHPLLYDSLFVVLRCACFKCGFFKVTDFERLVCYTRLKALRRGVVLHDAELLVTGKGMEEIECELNRMEGNTRNRRETRQKIVNEFMKKYGMKTKCPRCMHKSGRVVRGLHMRILVSNGEGLEQTIQDESDSQAKSTEEESTGTECWSQRGQESTTGEYITPGAIKRLMARLFTNEAALLEEFFEMKSESPFFLETLPVIPNKFRPPRYSNGKVFENPTNTLLAQIMARSVAAEGDTRHWPELQSAVLIYFDGSYSQRAAVGLKQNLEKKEGLFRKNIMGKRVNYAARSVISPDPHLHTREVGVPRLFASVLTFPEHVTLFNLERLRAMVVNGPEYPGASFVQSGEALTSLTHVSRRARLAIANQLGDGDKIVWRHLLDGDPLLVNRQPTLHAVSLMGHTARVLKNEKTLRIHYVNCKPYNADFDGDEMNIHLPQSSTGLAEALFVAHNDQNYFLPSVGRPIRGLEQDHIVAATRLTMKETFFTPDEFAVLLQGVATGKSRFHIPAPAILSPVRLYTGKQALTFVLLNRGLLLNFGVRCRLHLPGEESRVRIRRGRLLTGVLDRNTLGAATHTLIHACGELFGYFHANELLTTVSRIVNSYILARGFTVRFDDLLMNAGADQRRAAIFEEAEECARLDALSSPPPAGFYLDPQLTAALDARMRSRMNAFTTRTVDLIGDGLAKLPPHNNMHNIIDSGAKGSIVNLSQICCALGQQELEGQRVPAMLSGKTLPCFRPLEPSPAAGGYVYERFLTGINPATFFFHSMAGREGLVDTAIKTASSGYLQRCLVKHLEGLRAEYDLSVRSCGQIIQFHYGEDGIDCTKESYLYDTDFFANNFGAISKLAGLNCGGTWLNARLNNLLLSNSLNEKLARFLRNKGALATVEPGRAVGLIAAQSIGEPSTQMTLNTFHLAGVGNKNVTLGIPRLSEILMTASKNIRTPMLTIPLHSDCLLDALLESNLAAHFERLTLDSCLSSIQIVESACQVAGEYRKRVKITFEVQRNEAEVARAIDSQFLRLLGKELKRRTSAVGITEYVMKDGSSQQAAHENQDQNPEQSCDESESDANSDATDAGANPTTDMDDEQTDGCSEHSEHSEHPDVGAEHSNGAAVDNSSQVGLTNIKKIGKGKYLFSIYYPSAFSVWLLPVVEEVARKTVVREVPGLRNASWNGRSLNIEGSDFSILVSTLNHLDLFNFLDVFSFTSNDIHSVYVFLGVEAARSVIVQEIINVFDVYGININIRHLYLVADYMTHRGRFDPFSRTAFTMDDSFIQRMSFESSYANLKKSALFSDQDALEGPSASIAVGNRMKCGTGSFDLYYKLDTQ